MTTSEASLPRNTHQWEPELPEELATRFRQIAGLAENWNGYGAPPIDVGLHCGCHSRHQDWPGHGLCPLPSVAPGGDAGIGIEWETERWELSIDLVPGGQTTYALDRLHPDGATEESDGAIEDDDQIRRIISLMV